MSKVAMSQTQVQSTPLAKARSGFMASEQRNKLKHKARDAYDVRTITWPQVFLTEILCFEHRVSDSATTLCINVATTCFKIVVSTRLQHNLAAKVKRA